MSVIRSDVKLSRKTVKILPVRCRERTEIVSRILSDYAASVVPQGTMAKWPGYDTPGGAILAVRIPCQPPHSGEALRIAGCASPRQKRRLLTG